MNLFRTNKTINTVLIVLIILFSVGVLALIGNNILTKDDYEKVSLNFERGSLTTYGKYSETNESIYTKDSYDIEYGFKVELNFNSTIKYQLFFYDDLDNFISSTNYYEESIDFESFNLPVGAKKVRLVITPIYSDELLEDEKIIKWYEINKYSKQLKLHRIVKESNDILVIDSMNALNSTLNDELVCIFNNGHSEDIEQYYRIYLKFNSDNYYSIIETAVPNQLIDDTFQYTYVLTFTEKFSDKDVVKILKNICIESNPKQVFVYESGISDNNPNLEYNRLIIYKDKDTFLK